MVAQRGKKNRSSSKKHRRKWSTDASRRMKPEGKLPPGKLRKLRGDDVDE